MSETSNSIKRSSTRAPRKPKKSQIPYAILLGIAIFGFGLYLAAGNQKLAVFWMFGIAFGYVLQRSRFCFTAAFRDPSLTGSTTLTRAVFLAYALTSFGYIAIKLGPVLNGAEKNMNMVGVAPIGIPLVLGGILFGIGMVISGGCASGTLMRIGEGFTMQIISLVFFVGGFFWATHDAPFWNKMNANAPKVFLPDVLGWVGAVVVQFLIIGLLYMAAIKWQKKKLGNAD